VSYSGIKIYNYLPPDIKKLSHEVKKFKITLKTFLLQGSFYMIDEYFDSISRKDLGSLFLFLVLLNIFSILCILGFEHFNNYNILLYD
jgi:hypothetical protein